MKTGLSRGLSPHGPVENEEKRDEGEEGREADGEFADAQKLAAKTGRLEDERGLPLERLVLAPVGEVRREPVAGARHVRRNRRVAGLARLEDGRERHHGDPHREKRRKREDEDRKLLFHIVCPVVYNCQMTAQSSSDDDLVI